FQAVLRFREGVVLLVVEYAVAVWGEPGGAAVVLGRPVGRLGHGGGAAAPVDVEVVAVRIAAQLFDLAGGEVGLVLLVVAVVDGELDRVVGEGIDEACGDVVRGQVLAIAAFPGRNGTVGVAGHLGAQWRGLRRLGGRLEGEAEEKEQGQSGHGHCALLASCRRWSVVSSWCCASFAPSSLACRNQLWAYCRA